MFLLNGYAGTGKTSVVAALVKALRAVRRPTVLLAPTGRAAKVLGTFAEKKAMTIHRKIYKGLGDVAAVAGVGDNPHVNAIFIVDEASMIGDGGQDSLLDDLAQYVYGSGHDCRMILLGDGAQAPRGVRHFARYVARPPASARIAGDARGDDADRASESAFGHPLQRNDAAPCYGQEH